MNTGSPQESKIKYYNSRESVGVWNGIIATFGLLIGVATLQARSFTVTFGMLLGTCVVWYAGYRFLSTGYYFISATTAGFKDSFQFREFKFEEVTSATKAVSRSSIKLILTCKTRTVTIPLDPIDETWFSAVKTELLNRGIAVSSTAFGFVQ